MEEEEKEEEVVEEEKEEKAADGDSLGIFKISMIFLDLATIFPACCAFWFFLFFLLFFFLLFLLSFKIQIRAPSDAELARFRNVTPDLIANPEKIKKKDKNKI